LCAGGCVAIEPLRASAPTAREKASVPKLPAQTKPVLPMKVRLRVADLARVSDEDREEFCDVIQLPVQLIWELNRRATGTEAQKPCHLDPNECVPAFGKVQR
jgi:hypothetical protein